MSGNIYVLQSEITVAGRYKIGRCSGTPADLLGRYTTLGLPKIEYFVHCMDALSAERNILSALDQRRVVTSSGVKTKWVDCPLEDIKCIIDAVVDNYAGIEPKTTPKTAPTSAPKPRNQPVRNIPHQPYLLMCTLL